MEKDNDAFINELKELEQRTYRTDIKIQKQINNEIRDARVSTFYFMAQVIRSLKIYLILKKEYLDRREWYDETYVLKYKQQWPVVGNINYDDHRVLTKEFNDVMLMCYTQILFSIVESEFRLFLMTIDPNALKGKKDSFSNVYEALLGPTSKINKPHYQEFLRFFALIRNTIHNNGKYMNAKKQYVPIEYREKKYEFKHNEFVNYSGGAFPLLLLQITPDVIDMMEDIILNSELIKINSIPEPVYNQSPTSSASWV